MLASRRAGDNGSMATPALTDDTATVSTRTLMRGLAVLECFGSHGPRLTLQQIAEATGLPKATAFRLVHTLEAAGWLRHDGLQNYSLASKVTALSATAPGVGILEAARPVMRDLAERSGHSVTLHTLAGNRRIWLEAIATAPILRAIHYSRQPVPLCLGGATLALLASMPPLELQTLLPGAAESMGCPVPELQSIIDTARRQGYAVSHGGGAEGITGIAAPIATGKQGGVLCITIVLPTPAAKGQVVELIDMVRAAAAEISARLASD
jgi:DNA-binding IclR family transcriptional regulator